MIKSEAMYKLVCDFCKRETGWYSAKERKDKTQHWITPRILIETKDGLGVYEAKEVCGECVKAILEETQAGSKP